MVANSRKMTTMNQNPENSANRNTSSDYPLWQLITASFISGLVIVSYVLLIHTLEKGKPSENPLEEAAKLAAGALTEVHLQHSGFGFIGLCDSLEDENAYDHATRRIRSINSVKATLRACAILAGDLGQTPLLDLVEKDLVELEGLEAELISAIWKAVQADGSRTGIHYRVEELLRRKLSRQGRLEEVKIVLGRYGKTSGGPTLVKAPERDKDEAFVQSGFYRENIDIPTLREHHLQFHRLGSEIDVIEPRNFRNIAHQMEPSAVMIEATLESDAGSGAAKRFVLRACATIGAPKPPPVSTCLALHFPHGLPRQFASTRDFLDDSVWLGGGRWLTARDGSVPGNGELEKNRSLGEMLPSQALAVGIYHWLRGISTPVDPDKALDFLATRFETDRLEKSRGIDVNSCLVKDTGARERALSRGFEAGSSGQKALKQLFEYQGTLTEYPASAFPIAVNTQGEARMAGRSRYDASLIADYQDALYNTNLAALETMATARTFIRRADVEISLISRRADSERKRLASIERHHLAGETAEQARKRLTTMIAIDTTRKELLGKARSRARTAGQNAFRAASRSYELAASTFTLCRNGLHRIVSPYPAFLLGRDQVFIPIYQPLAEDQLFAETPRRTSPWLENGLSISKPIRQAFARPGTVRTGSGPLDMVMAEHNGNDLIKPATIILDALDFESGVAPSTHIAAVYPFANQPVPEGQGFFYDKRALATGEDPKVIWSVVMRDCLARQDGSQPGRTLVGSDWHWCEKFSPPIGTCPELAVEFQLRRPLPEPGGLPFDTFVRDPVYKRQAPLIPPLPAQMM